MKAIIMSHENGGSYVMDREGNFRFVRGSMSLPVGTEIAMKSQATVIYLRNSAIAACIAVVALLSSFALIWNTEKYSVYVDINPSVELVFNNFNRLKAAKPLNEDGAELLKGLSLKGKPEDVIVNLIKSAEEKGFLNPGGDTAAVLITVTAKGGKAPEEYRELIDAVITSNNMQGYVDVQISDNKDLKERADELGISPGKLGLIERLYATGQTIEYSQLVNMPVKNLMEAIREAEKQQITGASGQGSGNNSEDADNPNKGPGNNSGNTDPHNTGNGPDANSGNNDPHNTGNGPDANSGNDDPHNTGNGSDNNIGNDRQSGDEDDDQGPGSRSQGSGVENNDQGLGSRGQGSGDGDNDQRSGPGGQGSGDEDNDQGPGTGSQGSGDDKNGNNNPNQGPGNNSGNNGQQNPNAGPGNNSGNNDPNPNKGSGNNSGNNNPNQGPGNNSGNNNPNQGPGNNSGNNDPPNPNQGPGNNNGNNDPNPNAGPDNNSGNNKKSGSNGNSTGDADDSLGSGIRDQGPGIFQGLRTRRHPLGDGDSDQGSGDESIGNDNPNIGPENNSGNDAPHEPNPNIGPGNNSGNNT